MKKLLAIAIAAAITVPMSAMADTKVYGKAHMSVGKESGKSGIFVESHSSRIGLKGANALDNGLTATHQFEIGYNYLDEEGNLSPRNSWVGLKGGFGEVRVGRQTTPYSIVDDAASFTTRLDHKYLTFARVPNAIAYINKFGAVGFAAAIVADKAVDPALGANTTNGNISNVLVNYSAGPLYAGVAFQGMPHNLKNGSKIALAYKGANYGVGYVHEKQPGTGDKVDYVAGKYGFGKAYVAGQYGKNKGTNKKQKTVEIGYKLGKGTKTYYEWEDLAGKKSNRVGLVHKF